MFEMFPDLPKEAIIKQDILRLGVTFTNQALSFSKDYKPKDYFIFSFDHIKLGEMQEHEANGSPEEIKLTNGVYNLLPTIVSVRVNPFSPYQVQLLDEKIILLCEGVILAEVEFPPIPEYYKYKLSSGKK